MEQFTVPAESSEVFRRSALVQAMSMQADQHAPFPVVIRGRVYTFHDVDGGYSEEDDAHVVQLIQHRDPPPSDEYAGSEIPTDAEEYTVQLFDNWTLYPEDVRTLTSDEGFVLSLLLDSYHFSGQPLQVGV